MLLLLGYSKVDERLNNCTMRISNDRIGDYHGHLFDHHHHTINSEPHLWTLCFTKSGLRPLRTSTMERRSFTILNDMTPLALVHTIREHFSLPSHPPASSLTSPPPTNSIHYAYPTFFSDCCEGSVVPHPVALRDAATSRDLQ